MIGMCVCLCIYLSVPLHCKAMLARKEDINVEKGSSKQNTREESHGFHDFLYSQAFYRNVNINMNSAIEFVVKGFF